MQFDLSGQTIDIAFTDINDPELVADELLAHPGVQAEIDEMAGEFYFSAWQADRNLEDETINAVMQVLFKSGRDAAIEFMEDNLASKPSDAFYYQGGREIVRAAFDDLFDNMLVETEVDEEALEEIKDHVLRSVREAIEAKLEEKDGSTPEDFFSNHDKVRVSFIQGYGKYGYIDDIDTCSDSTIVSADTVKPNIPLMLQLKLFNVSPVEFVQYMKTEYDLDLINPAFDDSVSRYERQKMTEVAQGWRYVCAAFKGEDLTEVEQPPFIDGPTRLKQLADLARQTKDVSRPSSLSLKRIASVLNNATYGGVATWYGYLNAGQLLNGLADEPFYVQGGQIGVHNFVGGSGHIVDAEGPTLIDAKAGKLFTDKDWKANPDKVYGFVGSAMRAEVLHLDAQRDVVQFSSDIWRTFADDDGAYVEIVKDKASQFERYLLTSKDWENGQYGPFEDTEFVGNLKEATEHASVALSLYQYAMKNQSTNAPTM
jgi:hypothetical protein